MKFSLLMAVAVTAQAQVPNPTPIYSPDYSGIDQSPVGQVIRSLAGNDNKHVLKEKILNLFNEAHVNANPDLAAALTTLGFRCTNRKCEYHAFYASKVMANTWSQSARTTYLISIPDLGDSHHIDIDITQSNLDPQHLGSGQLSQFLSRWPVYKTENELIDPLKVFITENLAEEGTKDNRLKLLGFTCNAQCTYSGYIILHHVRDYKVTDEYYNYDIKTSLDGRDISATVRLTKNRE